MWLLLGLNVVCVFFLFFCLFESSCFLSFWFVLELLSLSIIPHFFFWSPLFSQRSLFYYFIICVFSSFFLVCGILVVDFRSFFIGLGVLIKLGVFPFMGWVYEVVVSSGWVVVWFISGLLKVPFFFVAYLPDVSLTVVFCTQFVCVCCFLVLSINFWKTSFSWRYCWCHMMLSASACLVVLSLCCSLSDVFLVFGVYFVWSSLVLLFFSMFCDCRNGLNGYGIFVYVVLLVSFPLSLVIFYKLVFVFYMLLFTPFVVFFSWAVYTISEQLFLVFFVVSGFKVRDCVSLLSFV